jgi:hypothetical protein
LAGLYNLGAVDLVREQIESQLLAPRFPDRISPTSASPPAPRGYESHPYDIAGTGLIVWPHRHYEAEVNYSLEDEPTCIPRPRSLARAAGLNPILRTAIVFSEHSLKWDDWRDYWEMEQNSSAVPMRLLPQVELLASSNGEISSDSMPARK